jgi:hypothetical protein
MGWCKDNSTTFLAGLGYSVIRVPREGIKPCDLVGRDGDVMRLGTLDQLLSNPGSALPTPTADQVAAQINGQVSSKLKLAVGINVLGNLLGALAGTKLGIDAAYKSASTIQFEFKDVVFDSVAPLSVGQYLRGAVIDVGNPVLDRYVMGKGELYLITEVLKSASITVKAERSKEGGVAVEIPVIEQVASGKIGIDVSQAASGVVTYTGTKPLAFGFKCFRVGLDDGELQLSPMTPGDLALSAGHAAQPAVGRSSGLIDIEDGNLVQ